MNISKCNWNYTFNKDQFGDSMKQELFPLFISTWIRQSRQQMPLPQICSSTPQESDKDKDKQKKDEHRKD